MKLLRQRGVRACNVIRARTPALEIFLLKQVCVIAATLDLLLHLKMIKVLTVL